jgi:hypothetical protein
LAELGKALYRYYKVRRVQHYHNRPMSTEEIQWCYYAYMELLRSPRDEGMRLLLNGMKQLLEQRGYSL